MTCSNRKVVPTICSSPIRLRLCRQELPLTYITRRFGFRRDQKYPPWVPVETVRTSAPTIHHALMVNPGPPRGPAARACGCSSGRCGLSGHRSGPEREHKIQFGVAGFGVRVRLLIRGWNAARAGLLGVFPPPLFLGLPPTPAARLADKTQIEIIPCVEGPPQQQLSDGLPGGDGTFCCSNHFWSSFSPGGRPTSVLPPLPPLCQI